MPMNRGSENGTNSYPQARPFDEFLMGNPIGTGDCVIYSSGNPQQALRQYQSYEYQSNATPGTFENTVLPPIATLEPRVS
jgi:hypothetical protein